MDSIKNFDSSTLHHVEPVVDELSLQRWLETEPDPFLSFLTVARQGTLEAATSWILNGKVKINGNNNAWTPLTWAVKQGKLDLVVWLLEHGADANLRDPSNNQPLHYAGNFALIKALVDHGADIHAKSGYNNESILGNISDVEAVRFLIGRGINVNHQNGRGATALHFATILSLMDKVRVLVEEGHVDTSIKDCDGKTALDMAIDLEKQGSDKAKIIEYLKLHKKK